MQGRLILFALLLGASIHNSTRGASQGLGGSLERGRLDLVRLEGAVDKAGSGRPSLKFMVS